MKFLNVKPGGTSSTQWVFQYTVRSLTPFARQLFRQSATVCILKIHTHTHKSCHRILSIAGHLYSHELYDKIYSIPLHPITCTYLKNKDSH